MRHLTCEALPLERPQYNAPRRGKVGSIWKLWGETFDLCDNAEIAEAVRQFNDPFGEMERALWCLSVNSRESLIAGESSPVLEALVWTIRVYWSVQGPSINERPPMALALAELMTWSPELFEPQTDYGPGAARNAWEWVDELVRRSMSLGVRRRNYSWASKVLHYVLPWRVPVFDSNVRGFLGVPKTWDLPHAYRGVAEGVFERAARITARECNCNWTGELEPRSPLRALDKYLWWKSAGGPGNAPIFRDPCQVLRRLGLTCVTGNCGRETKAQ